MLTKSDLSQLLPHAGTMCLIDKVSSWNNDSITCTTMSHLARDNPLRQAGNLPTVCGIEYGAQAMAIHGNLIQQSQTTTPTIGYLASVRSLKMNVLQLDNITGEIKVSATKLVQSDRSLMYEFELSANNSLLLSGRAAVVLQDIPQNISKNKL